MRSLEDIQFQNLCAEVGEALERITSSQITSTDKVGMLAIEVKAVDESITSMSKDLNNSVIALSEAMAQHERLDRQQRNLQSKRRELLSGIVTTISKNRAKSLIQHLTAKKEGNP